MTTMIGKPGPATRRVSACPHPEKKAWPTCTLAESARIRVLGEMVCHEHEGKMPVRSYRCYCNWWHHTSHPLRLDR